MIGSVLHLRGHTTVRQKLVSSHQPTPPPLLYHYKPILYCNNDRSVVLVLRHYPRLYQNQSSINHAQFTVITLGCWCGARAGARRSAHCACSVKGNVEQYHATVAHPGTPVLQCNSHPPAIIHCQCRVRTVQGYSSLLCVIIAAATIDKGQACKSTVLDTDRCPGVFCLVRRSWTVPSRFFVQEKESPHFCVRGMERAALTEGPC